MPLRLSILLCAALAVTGIASGAPADSVRVTISLEQDPAVYEESDYGEAPQLAIWLEDPADNSVHTVYVTRRAGTGDYYGKVECPVSLPVWVAAWRRETGKTGFPTPRQPVPEAVTAATSDSGKVTAEIRVPKGRKYLCYIEMNVAADFNSVYPFENGEGVLDDHNNGQPSLIYRGEIVGQPGESSTPEPVGRTAQYQFVDSLIQNLDGMESALKCLKNIKVTCSAN